MKEKIELTVEDMTAIITDWILRHKKKIVENAHWHGNFGLEDVIFSCEVREPKQGGPYYEKD